MDDLDDQRSDIDFDVAKSIRYHSYRRSFWQTLDSWAKILTVLSGTAVLVSFARGNHAASEIFAFIVAFTSAADLVFGFSAKSHTHDSLYREFSRLGQDIIERSAVTEKQISLWRRKRLEIEMDEPGVIDWLERRCSAEEARARGLEVNAAWKLPRWKVYLSQLAMWPSAPQI